MFCKVILVGNLGQDPELKFTGGGQAVAHLRVATSRAWTDKDSGQKKEETLWLDVEVWGKQAESCGKFLKKGRQALIEGRLKLDQWEKDGQKRERMKVVAESVRFIGGGKKDEGGEEHPNVAAAREQIEEDI
jgi:single-strand DNA-binding protein